MPIPADFLEELKARLDLVAIVSRHVALTRRGREHLGLCPFHQEKTPSFTVNEQKGFYHCFGCGAHGTAIDFVMQRERLSFRDRSRLWPPARACPCRWSSRATGHGRIGAMSCSLPTRRRRRISRLA